MKKQLLLLILLHFTLLISKTQAQGGTVNADVLNVNNSTFKAVNPTETYDFNSTAKSFINFGMNARGGSAEAVSNAGALYGIKLTAQKQFPTSNSLENKTVIYGLVSEDVRAGYARRVGAAIYTSELDQVAVERMRITGGGDVVIGQTEGRAKLTISAPDRTIKSALAIRQSNALSYGFDFGLDQSLNGNMYLKMIHNDAVANENVMVFDRLKGYVGVGISPTSIFHVAGKANEDAFLTVQRNAFVNTMGLALHPTGTASNTNKAWGYGVWGNTNNLRIWDWNGEVSSTKLTVLGSNGNVGIGTENPLEKLSVNGTVLAKKVIVKADGWPDYVFSKNYKLRSLNSLEAYISKYNHLPDVPSASKVEKGGLDVGSIQAALLRKIEELTLYMLKQAKQMEDLKKEIAALKSSQE